MAPPTETFPTGTGEPTPACVRSQPRVFSLMRPLVERSSGARHRGKGNGNFRTRAQELTGKSKSQNCTACRGLDLEQPLRPYQGVECACAARRGRIALAQGARLPVVSGAETNAAAARGGWPTG